MINVIVLGCGPAGLIAAQAAADEGADSIRILSKKRKSEMFGAQYLHEPIPGVTDESTERTVSYVLHGTVEQYRLKVYGDAWDQSVSPEDLQQTHSAWDIRDTYDRLWDDWGKYVSDLDISGSWLARYRRDHPADVIINSIPRPVLCHNHEEHIFRATKIWAAGDAPSRGIEIPYTCPRETVSCNGTDDASWYRISNIFGHKTVEWSQVSMLRPPPIQTAAEVTKPLSHNCSCHPGLIHVGRYGRWQKGVLSHEAYEHTREGILDRERRDGMDPLPGFSQVL